ncbi:unnamed protein product [Dovyalis caffra]|uniref:Glutamyl-tRNA reductase N-terminal domain-containing protein n=1 Tax=Dovyalis caffra TaxID=77055 RepID=A0AAV1S6T8_9ROSI|nr:unnamed protein product [Dovyalis caffra]
MEIYVVALSQHRGVKEVTEWMSKITGFQESTNLTTRCAQQLPELHRVVKIFDSSMTSGIPVSETCEYQFSLYNNDATQHLFEVSAGLASLVLGEGQILAQVKQVVKVGQGVVGFGRNLSGSFKHAITVGKQVRTETNIAAGAVSVSSASVELTVWVFEDGEK